MRRCTKRVRGVRFTLTIEIQPAASYYLRDDDSVGQYLMPIPSYKTKLVSTKTDFTTDGEIDTESYQGIIKHVGPQLEGLVLGPLLPVVRQNTARIPATRFEKLLFGKNPITHPMRLAWALRKAAKDLDPNNSGYRWNLLATGVNQTLDTTYTANALRNEVRRKLGWTLQTIFPGQPPTRKRRRARPNGKTD
jgi:hypothetical protein